MTGKSGTSEIATRYPCVDGIVAVTTKQKGHKESLVPEKTLILQRYKI